MPQLRRRVSVGNLLGDSSAVTANQAGGGTGDSCCFELRNYHVYREIVGIYTRAKISVGGTIREKRFAEEVRPLVTSLHTHCPLNLCSPKCQYLQGNTENCPGVTGAVA